MQDTGAKIRDIPGNTGQLATPAGARLFLGGFLAGTVATSV